MNLLMRRRELITPKISEKPNRATITKSHTVINNVGARKIYNTELRGNVKKGVEYKIEFDIHMHCDETDGGVWRINLWKYGLWNLYIDRFSSDPSIKDRHEHIVSIQPAGKDVDSTYNGFLTLDTNNMKGFVDITNFVVTEA